MTRVHTAHTYHPSYHHHTPTLLRSIPGVHIKAQPASQIVKQMSSGPARAAAPQGSFRSGARRRYGCGDRSRHKISSVKLHNFVQGQAHLPSVTTEIGRTCTRTLFPKREHLRPRMMTRRSAVLVCGATGRVGGEAARILLREASQTLEVRCLVRDASAPAAVELKEAGAVLHNGDYEHPDTLHTALDGVVAAFLVCSNVSTQVVLETNFIAAAEQSTSCRYVVKLGTVRQYVSDQSQIEYGRFHAAIEARLAQCSSSLTWTVLCPNCFMQNHVGDIFGSLPHRLIAYPHTDARARLVDTRDVGAVAAQLLVLAVDDGADGAIAATHKGKHYDVCGDNSVSTAELAAIYTRLLGADIRHVQSTAVDFQANLETNAHMEPWYAQAVTRGHVDFWATGKLDYSSSPEVRQLVPTFRSMDQWAQEMAPMVKFLS